MDTGYGSGTRTVLLGRLIYPIWQVVAYSQLGMRRAASRKCMSPPTEP